MSKEFNCKGKRLASYLVNSGFNLLRTERPNGSKVFVFEFNDAIERKIAEWESNKKRWLF